MNTSRSTLTIRGSIGLFAAILALGAGCTDRGAGVSDGSGETAAASNTSPAPMPGEQTPVTPTDSTMISGEVASVAGSALEVENSTTGDTTTVKLADDTVVTIDGRSSSASSLKQGQIVVVSTENQNGELVATSVSARSASPGQS